MKDSCANVCVCVCVCVYMCVCVCVAVNKLSICERCRICKYLETEVHTWLMQSESPLLEM